MIMDHRSIMASGHQWKMRKLRKVAISNLKLKSPNCLPLTDNYYNQYQLSTLFQSLFYTLERYHLIYFSQKPSEIGAIIILVYKYEN